MTMRQTQQDVGQTEPPTARTTRPQKKTTQAVDAEAADAGSHTGRQTEQGKKAEDMDSKDCLGSEGNENMVVAAAVAAWRKRTLMDALEEEEAAMQAAASRSGSTVSFQHPGCHAEQPRRR
jgi:hypothetical protein